VQDEETREHQSRLPRVEPDSPLAPSYALRSHLRSISWRANSPHIIALMLHNQQQHSTGRRQEQVGQARLVVQADGQAGLEVAQALPATLQIGCAKPMGAIAAKRSRCRRRRSVAACVPGVGRGRWRVEGGEGWGGDGAAGGDGAPAFLRGRREGSVCLGGLVLVGCEIHGRDAGFFEGCY
jgi:hypothetical protein